MASDIDMSPFKLYDTMLPTTNRSTNMLYVPSQGCTGPYAANVTARGSERHEFMLAAFVNSRSNPDPQLISRMSSVSYTSSPDVKY